MIDEKVLTSDLTIVSREIGADPGVNTYSKEFVQGKYIKVLSAGKHKNKIGLVQQVLEGSMKVVLKYKVKGEEITLPDEIVNVPFASNGSGFKIKCVETGENMISARRAKKRPALPPASSDAASPADLVAPELKVGSKVQVKRVTDGSKSLAPYSMLKGIIKARAKTFVTVEFPCGAKPKKFACEQLAPLPEDAPMKDRLTAGATVFLSKPLTGRGFNKDMKKLVDQQVKIHGREGEQYTICHQGKNVGALAFAKTSGLELVDDTSTLANEGASAPNGSAALEDDSDDSDSDSDSDSDNDDEDGEQDEDGLAEGQTGR